MFKSTVASILLIAMTVVIAYPVLAGQVHSPDSLSPQELTKFASDLWSYWRNEKKGPLEEKTEETREVIDDVEKTKEDIHSKIRKKTQLVKEVRKMVEKMDSDLDEKEKKELIEKIIAKLEKAVNYFKKLNQKKDEIRKRLEKKLEELKEYGNVESMINKRESRINELKDKINDVTPSEGDDEEARVKSYKLQIKFIRSQIKSLKEYSSKHDTLTKGVKDSKRVIEEFLVTVDNTYPALREGLEAIRMEFGRGKVQQLLEEFNKADESAERMQQSWTDFGAILDELSTVAEDHSNE